MGIFDEKADLFTRFRTTVEFRAKLFGGVPKDPNVIEGWLRAKAGITQEEELTRVVVRTLRELGAEELSPDETDFDKIVEASQQVAEDQKTNGFKRDATGLYIESRQVKAAIKESTNALFAGQRWGRTKKSPKNFVAEHIFVDPDKIYLGANEPTGIDLVIGHVTGPGGPRATLGYHEYVWQPTIEFVVSLDEVAMEHFNNNPRDLARLWTHIQENGIGAMRSQGHGRNDVTGWDMLNGKPSAKPKKK